ncbi:16S rRNA (guanine(966)-N(2))-methyltransferase RsmD [Croceivirga thetidis]|uniref:16S rRNA (Guanine(966)-N(2))-methyltransferase RsmD n=1 Tax=Croceivirga thetidis TaxID=2721623 RepID=A0ABX1GPU0_9FLAO|nr:16S rRNA (guanine(966)-N(2))-methyltransferase RsmD [Croceivirga thetidis]
MRIISGKYKGKRLLAPKKLPVRPTTDMAKEALFNILNNSFFFEEIKVLDLFAGTGNISFEFASRGAQDITAIDAHLGCIKFISKTAGELGFSINAFKNDVFSFLSKTRERYDVIFADPPYDLEISELQKIANTVFEKDLLMDDGVLVVEHSPQIDLSTEPRFVEQRKYGSSVFSFFE